MAYGYAPSLSSTPYDRVRRAVKMILGGGQADRYPGPGGVPATGGRPGPGRYGASGYGSNEVPPGADPGASGGGGGGAPPPASEDPYAGYGIWAPSGTDPSTWSNWLGNDTYGMPSFDTSGRITGGYEYTISPEEARRRAALMGITGYGAAYNRYLGPPGSSGLGPNRAPGGFGAPGSGGGGGVGPGMYGAPSFGPSGYDSNRYPGPPKPPGPPPLIGPGPSLDGGGNDYTKPPSQPGFGGGPAPRAPSVSDNGGAYNGGAYGGSPAQNPFDGGGRDALAARMAAFGARQGGGDGYARSLAWLAANKAAIDRGEFDVNTAGAPPNPGVNGTNDEWNAYYSNPANFPWMPNDPLPPGYREPWGNPGDPPSDGTVYHY